MTSRVPPTCPLIDKVIKMIRDEDFCRGDVENLLEDIRSANAQLRDNWNEEEDARERAENQVAGLEKEVEELKAALQEAKSEIAGLEEALAGEDL